MTALSVYLTALRTYRSYGDEDYAKRKAASFLRRCGGSLEETLPDDDGKSSGPESEIPESVIKQVIYAALDADSEKAFWRNANCI